jgi:hypothetical protein
MRHYTPFQTIRTAQQNECSVALFRIGTLRTQPVGTSRRNLLHGRNVAFPRSAVLLGMVHTTDNPGSIPRSLLRILPHHDAPNIRPRHAGFSFSLRLHPAVFVAYWVAKPQFHFKNLQVCKYLTALYSANSKLAGAHGDTPRSASRALRNPLRHRCGRDG